MANNINSASVIGIHSTTFDGPISGTNPSKLSGGSNVTFVSVGTANGGSTETGKGILKYDGDTLYLGSVLLPDMDVEIDASGITNVTTSGAVLNLSAPKTDTSSGSFSVDGGTSVVADFSDFSATTVSCVGVACPGIPFLNLDGLNYTIVGNITAGGGDVLTLTLETNNGSQLAIQVVTEPVSVTANIASVEVIGIHSTTFDGPISGSNPSKLAGGSNVTFSAAGTNHGGITDVGIGIIEFDGDNLVLGSLLLPDLDIEINASGISTVTTSGAVLNLSAPKSDTASGSFSVDGGTSVVADFSDFSAVTTSCVGVACPGIPFLNLDGLNYSIEGAVTEAGGDVLTLTLETNNGSLLAVRFTTVASAESVSVPFPSLAISLLAMLLGATVMYRKYQS
ncbi:hypothetical protein N9123_01500 [Pseudomonadales bacterium]|nr:hypothetical protein [Pseudomonadales bacterium]